MNPQFEYEVIALQRGGADGHQYHWHSDRCGRLGSHDCIGKALNERGADGWHVVAFTSDGRFGNTLVLQRQRPETLSVKIGIQPAAQSAAPVSGAETAAVLAAEIQGLRRDLVTALRPRRAPALEPEVAPILQAVATGLDQLATREVPVTVTTLHDPAAIQQLESSLVQEIRHLAQVVVALGEPRASTVTAPEPVPQSRFNWGRSLFFWQRPAPHLAR